MFSIGWFTGSTIANKLRVYLCFRIGVDDLNMCELSLEETGLAKKKGAEILGREFEGEWNKGGGVDYMKKNANKISSKFLQRRLNVPK